MDKKTMRSIALVMALLMFMSSCGRSESGKKSGEESGTEEVTAAETTAAEKTDWRTKTLEPCGDSVTFMVYMTGSNLESKTGAATSDMDEMAKSGINISNANVLVYTGGCEFWQSDVPADKNAVYELTADGFTQKTTFELQSMGEPSSLTRFLDYAYENYKTDSYCLILWDHGSGPLLGYGNDTLYDNDGMLLPEFRQALEDSPFGPDNKLSFIGFDACLMASCELVCTIDDYADYLIASQETEPAYGWDYSFLQKCGQVTTASMAEIIVDSYNEFYRDYYAGSDFSSGDITLAAIDLSYADSLETAINNLFVKAINGVSGEFRNLAVSRVSAKALGRASTGSEYDLVDLNSLVEEMSSIYPDESKAVSDIILKAITYNRTNTTGLAGLSIYYPFYNKKFYEKYWAEQYSELGVFSDYCNYLDRYAKLWLSTDTTQFADVGSPEQVNDTTYSLKLTDEQMNNLADASYYILRKVDTDTYTYTFFSNDVEIGKSDLTANFDGKIVYLNYPGGEKHPIIMQEKGSYGNVSDYYTCGSMYTFGDGLNISYESFAIELTLDKTTGEIKTTAPYYLTDEAIQSGKHEEINTDEFMGYEFAAGQQKYLTRDNNGQILDYWSWASNGVITGYESLVGDGLNFSYEPIYNDGSEYYIMFSMQGTNGETTSSELIPITLADAPEEEEPEATELDWNGSTTGIIPDIDCADVTFSAVNVYGSSLMQYELKAVNKADETLSVVLADIEADGVLVSDLSCGDIEPGESLTGQDSDISKACSFSGKEFPDSISFSLWIKSNRKTYVAGKRFTIKTDNVIPVTSSELFYDASADKQVVYDENGVEFCLLKIRSVSGDGSIFYRITNKTNEEKEISFRVIVNGIPYLSSVDEKLEPGEISYGSSDLSDYGYKYFEISSISSVSLEVTYNGEAKSYPVKLSESGNGQELSQAGKLVYSDDRIEIYEVKDIHIEASYEGFSPEPEKAGKIYYARCLGDEISGWYFNGTVNGAESDETELIAINAQPFTFSIPSGSYAYFAVVYPAEYSGQDVEFNFSYYEYSDFTNGDDGVITGTETGKETGYIKVSQEG